MIPLKSFYLLRHGESQANLEGYAAGSLDTPLTENGRNQAEESQRTLESLERRPEIIFHSPLSRARDTALTVNKVLNLPMLVHNGLAEQNYGDWSKQRWSEIRPLLHRGAPPPNGEPRTDFFARAQKAIAECLSQTTLLPLFVAHGGIFDAVLDHAGYPHTRIVNCALFEFIPASDGSWSWTDHTNLSAPAIALFEDRKTC